VTAQANATVAHGEASKPSETDQGKTKKIGRQLSVNSNGNHYSDVHRQEAERMLNGSGSTTPTTKESFFSHLRKRARRLSGRNQANQAVEDIEANAGCIPWSNRSSMALDGSHPGDPKPHSDLSELDKALQSVKYALDTSTLSNIPVHLTNNSDNAIKRQSMPTSNPGPISSRTRRALQMTGHPVHRYETPEEEDELLDEVLHSASKAANRLAQAQSLNSHAPDVSHRHTDGSHALPSPYPTPSPTAKADGYFETPVKQSLAKTSNSNSNRQWPTPPYEEAEWNNKATTLHFPSASNYI
jgi:meiosis induction protein kinase IME2/SME1